MSHRKHERLRWLLSDAGPRGVIIYDTTHSRTTTDFDSVATFAAGGPVYDTCFSVFSKRIFTAEFSAGRCPAAASTRTLVTSSATIVVRTHRQAVDHNHIYTYTTPLRGRIIIIVVVRSDCIVLFGVIINTVCPKGCIDARCNAAAATVFLRGRWLDCK